MAQRTSFRCRRTGTARCWCSRTATTGWASLSRRPAFLVGDELLARGYALAASGYRGTGYNLLEGIKDTELLVQHFAETVGTPDRTVLYGISMGGSLTIQSMEKYPDTYDAGIPLCSGASGITRKIAQRFTFALAYDAAFGWPRSWGPINDVRDNINFNQVLYPKTINELGMPGHGGVSLQQAPLGVHAASSATCRRAATTSTRGRSICPLAPWRCRSS